MNKNKEPGIVFNRIFLMRCNFERRINGKEERENDLQFNFRINNKMNKERTKLLVEFETLVGKKEEKSPIFIDVVMAGEFSINEAEKNLDLEEFYIHNAPAIIFPYIREYISDLTTRAGYTPPIILPPMNIINMMKELTKNPQND